MKNIIIISFMIMLLASSCTTKIKDGTYYLHSVYRGVPSNIIGEQDQELQVMNSNIKLIVYEAYLEPINGIIDNNKIIFANGDTLTFKKTKDGLLTYKDEFVYTWVYKK